LCPEADEPVWLILGFTGDVIAGIRTLRTGPLVSMAHGDDNGLERAAAR